MSFWNKEDDIIAYMEDDIIEDNNWQFGDHLAKVVYKITYTNNKRNVTWVTEQ